MNFLHRACISIKRNLGKTSILFFVLLILSMVISGTISVSLAIETTESNLRANMLPVAIIEMDSERAWEIYEETGIRVCGRIEPEKFHMIGELLYVRGFDYSITNVMFNPNLERYEPKIDGVEVWNYGQGGSGFGEGFSLKGTHNPGIIEIEQGVIELVAGRVFEQEEINNFSNVAIISESFANLNNLVVGSTFSMRNILFDYGAGGAIEEIYSEENIIVQESFDLEVVGLFRPTIVFQPDNPWEDWETLNLLQNRIYTPNNFTELTQRFMFERIVEYAPEWWGGEIPTFEDIMIYENIFTLYTSEYLSSFRVAVSRILPDYFRVIDTGSVFRDAETALELMRELTLRILWLAIGATILILTLLIMLFIRDRKKEIGIYLALGERKGRIISQIAIEVMVVAFLAMIIALFIGILIADNMSQTMLINNLVAQQEVDIWHWDQLAHMGFRNDLTSEEIIESYNVSLSLGMLFRVLVVGLGTVLLAIVIPFFYITRLNPKEIMM